MNHHSLWLRLSLAAALLLLAAACSSDDDGGGGPSESASATDATTTPQRSADGGAGVTDDQIVLGMTNDLEGAGGTRYSIITEAVSAYFAKVNDEDGGVCDRQIDLIAEDDQYAGAVSLEKTKKLAEEHQVAAVIGAVGADAHLAAVDYLNDPNADGNKDDGIPDLFVSSGYSGWGDVARWPWTTGFVPDYVTDARVLARYLEGQSPAAKVGILYANDTLGLDYLAALKEELGEMIVTEQPHDAATLDVSAQVAAIRDAGADTMFLATTPQFAAGAVVAADAVDYAPQLYLSYVNTAATMAGLIGGGQGLEQLEAGFERLEGSVSTKHILDPAGDVDEPEMVEHKRIMEDYDGPAVSSLSVYGQSLGELVIHTLDIACENGDLTRAGILEAAESIEGYHPSLLLDGIEVTLGPRDHYAIQSLMPVEIGADGTLTELQDDVTSLD